MSVNQAMGGIHMQTEIMTAHQFDGLIKMTIKIIEASEDKQDAINSLKDLLKDKSE